jgi:uncharacterized protein YyaL (SSP411 family)
MSNQLAQETSPYLLQHADNPVDWYPWRPETLQLARTLDKPILLSIGYSACHWCHVMARESFEDAEIAALMNRHFINIKVDREERPDLDHIYQTAHHLLTRRNGGWPLTMFLDPDGVPFFGGTYFPKMTRYNLPGFPDLLVKVAQAYAEKRAELVQQGTHLVAALTSIVPTPESEPATFSDQPLNLAVRQHKASYDRVNGGFGDAPKFLHPAELDLLLRAAVTTGDDDSGRIVMHTLQQMAHGGLFDQLGGGFARYSVDAQWDIPHFEKMLYDNGLLLGLYSSAWQVGGNALFADVVTQTAGWVMREMQSPQGGYYSSLDADSEHEEGKFYVWHRNEIRDLLSSAEYDVVQPYYGLDSTPNFEHREWNLRVATPLHEIAPRLNLPLQRVEQLLESSKNKLFAARELRVHPGRDEKILSAWNGLMIAGMARASRIFGRRDWLDSAQRAMEFVRTTLWHDDNLLATYKDGKAHLNAYLDDHAFLLDALLELLQSEYRRADMEFAMEIADALLTRFEDETNGGFYFTSHDHEALIQRTKIGQDNATPSGNGIAAQALLRVSVLTGDMKYQNAAERCIKLFYPALKQSAGYHSSLCTALGEILDPPSLLVLRGDEAEARNWRRRVLERYRPGLLVITLTESESGLPEALDKPLQGRTTGWLCRGSSCLPPLFNIDELLAQIDQSANSEKRSE